MQWKITIEGVDELGSAHRAEMEIKKDFDRLDSGEIGFSVEDGKVIMARLQAAVVRQLCETSAGQSGSALVARLFEASRTAASAQSARSLDGLRSRIHVF